MNGSSTVPLLLQVPMIGDSSTIAYPGEGEDAGFDVPAPGLVIEIEDLMDPLWECKAWCSMALN
jgi:hypothetical protein